MPSYQVSATTRAYRGFKKLPKEILARLQIEFEEISKTPFTVGQRLKGELSQFYSRHFKQNNVNYRIVYSIVESKQEVIVHKAGTRENFYKNLL